MNEQQGERLGPEPKLETIVGEAIEIANNFDTGRAIAYIVNNTEPAEERYRAISTFAHAFKPRVMSRARHLHGRGLTIEEFRQRTAATHLGEEAVKTVFDEFSDETLQ